MTRQPFLSIFFFWLIVFCAPPIWAQQDPGLKIETRAGGYTIRHVIFNSTFVLPDIAKIHGLKRSKYESLLNVSVSPEGVEGTSIPARLRGTSTNLMQQQKTLAFKEIREPNTTYYLAPVRVGNEEVLRFELEVTPEGSDTPIIVNFKQTVYADE